MDISKLQLEQLASHIVKDLKCDCGCKFGDHYNEPCACGWTHIEEMFRDDFNVELKMYKDSYNKWYMENYGIKLKE